MPKKSLSLETDTGEKTWSATFFELGRAAYGLRREPAGRSQYSREISAN